MARIGNRTAPGRYTLGAWKEQEARTAEEQMQQHVITTDRMTVVRCTYQAGALFMPHFHPQEQVTIVEQGVLIFEVDGDEITVDAGEMIAIPAHVRHSTRVGHGPAQALNLFTVSETAYPDTIGARQLTDAGVSSR